MRVDGRDWARLGAEAERWAVFVGHRAFMRMEAGHCAALERRRDDAGVAEYFCRVYEQRPQICRDLARGSSECEGERATKGDRVSGGAAAIEP